MSISITFLSSILLLSLCTFHVSTAANNPVTGFTSLPLNHQSFEIQKPNNISLEDRYSHEKGIRRFWVYDSDNPVVLEDPVEGNVKDLSKPFTEARIKGHDFSYGEYQFEGHAFVPNGTSGVAIMRLCRSTGGSVLQLRIDDGDLTCYGKKLQGRKFYDDWFRVNVIHNANTGKLRVFINGFEKFKMTDYTSGDRTFHFRFGVYPASYTNTSSYMESRWKVIKVFVKNGDDSLV